VKAPNRKAAISAVVSRVEESGPVTDSGSETFLVIPAAELQLITRKVEKKTETVEIFE
jgi:hypothetical protein